jgi:Cyanophycinase and related exopeptidases
MTQSQSPSRGNLFLIGGSAKQCLRSFVKLAGGKKARVVLVPHATIAPRRNSEELEAELTALGCGSVTTIMPRAQFEIPNGTTAVYMLGGDQVRLVRLLGESGRAELARFHAGGGLVAGTSAGAAGVVETMVTGGMRNGLMIVGSLQTGGGLGLLGRAMVDTHFKERRRFSRMMAAVSGGGFTGIGLDEDTAVLITPQLYATVYGAGQVAFFAPTDCVAVETRKNKPGHHTPTFSVAHVLVSVLTAGSTFSLANGKLVPTSLK